MRVTMCKWRIPGGFSLFLYLAMLTLLPLWAQRASLHDRIGTEQQSR